MQQCDCPHVFVMEPDDATPHFAHQYLIIVREHWIDTGFNLNLQPVFQSLGSNNVAEVGKDCV